MKSGKCPKCGSDQVYSGESVLFKSGPFACNAIPVGLTSVASLDNFACADCGYVEAYIADPRKLKEIARRWDRVPHPGDDETASE